MLKRKLIVFVLWLGLWLPGRAQHIVWQKIFGAQGVSFDGLGSIMALEDGTFLSVGFSSLFGGYVSNTNLGSLDGSVLLRLDENGDTIFVKKLNIMVNVVYNTTPYIGHKYGDIYWAAIWGAIQVGASWIYCPVVVEFTAEGAILQTHIYAQYQDWFVTGAVATPDYGMILSGYFFGGLTLPTQMMSMKINFLGEVEWANKWNPPAQVRGEGNRIFQTKPNEYLITGTLGRRIGGFTFDSLGNQIDTKVFYDTPSMIQFNQGEATPGAEKTMISTGQYRSATNQIIGYFGLLDSANQKVWGGEKRGAFRIPQANTDGSVWVEYYNSTSLLVSLDKFTKDSVKLKSIPLYTAGINGSVFYQYLPLGNNQVLAVGHKDTDNAGYQFIITKIDSFGVPITATEKLISKPPRDYRQIIAFPNPATQTVQFKNLDEQGQLRLYNLKGQMVKEEDIQPQEVISIHTLASGEYMWHISTADKKIYTGRILKE